ncbi:RNA polymerase-binding protein DksA [Dyella sp. 20L07]|uniref:RNA polymerase-binding protein DksA n=1 Tax=Dyella sp. 20L07 TaxID=3384240 RepID=UPI003D2C40DE
MAKTTRSATATKPQKGKPAGKVKDVKPGKKAVAGGRSVKSAPTKAAPAKKPVAKKAAVKKVVAKKVAAKQPAAKKVAKAPAKPVVAKKAAPKPQAKKAAPAKKPVVVKKVAKPVAKKAAAPAKKEPPKAVAKPVASPIKVAKAPPAKPVAKAAPPAKAAPKQAAPVPVKAAPVVAPAVKPAALPLTGKVASATARHTIPNKQKAQQSSMNNPATLDNGITREDGRYALPSTTTIDLPKGYRPSNDEEYMNPKHLAYFRNKLRDWRDQLVEESRQTMENLRDEVRDVGDEAERATRETENSLELRTRDRYRKLISKIDKALRRIEEGRYGYCEETDEEIGVDRLDARPIATLSLDAQERREHLQKQMGD